MPESVINKFDKNSNFWTQNPQFKAVEPFKSLYKADRSKSKRNSSTIMWGIAFLKDPGSILYKMPEEQRREAILKDYIDLRDFKFEDYEEHIERFEEMVTTQAERSLQKFYEKLKERDEFINNHPYSFLPPVEGSSKTMADILDSMMKGTNELYKTYTNIKKDIETEKDSKEVGKGGAQPSASDTGEI